MEQQLADKVAIVTGAGQGIGKGVALRLARAGAQVVIAEYNQETAEATCAEVLDLTPEDWDRVVDTNQRGLFFCLQAVARQMIAQIPEEIRNADRAPHSFGKIVNFASVAGRSGRPYSTHYAAAKAAVINITKSAALALAKYNINVNAVAPGVALTPMWAQIDKERGEIFGSKPGEALHNFVESNIPLKRASTVEDLAGAVSFLCSPDADYITGQCLNVDGGIEMD